nr:hypothetical protein [Tanacetum cinerariifolium]
MRKHMNCCYAPRMYDENPTIHLPGLLDAMDNIVTKEGFVMRRVSGTGCSGVSPVDILYREVEAQGAIVSMMMPKEFLLHPRYECSGARVEIGICYIVEHADSMFVKN